MSNPVYLLPEMVGEGGNQLFLSAVQVSAEPVRVQGYKLFTFLRRLNNTGFSTYCVAVECPSKSCIMYKVHFGENIPDFEGTGFLTTPTSHGIIIHIAQSTFDILDKTDKAVPIKSGDWLREMENFNQLAAMHYLGVIPDFSPAIFSQYDLYNEWRNKVHQSYGTYGDFTKALSSIFRRSVFAINFFCINSAVTLLSKCGSESTYCFAALYECLKESPEISTMKNILPINSNLDSPFIVLYHALKITFDCLNAMNNKILSLDDKKGFTAAVKAFQEQEHMQVGCCDLKTLRRMLSNFEMQRYSELPIFKMAGINIRMSKEPDFPMIIPIERPEKNPLAEDVRKEINNAIVAMPDPAAKIQWMNNEIEASFGETDAKCKELDERVDEIEKQIVVMSRQLKEVVEESKTAAKKVQAASKTLENVYQAHNKIQGKFDILREKLYLEQRSTRVTLIISIVLVLIGAISLRL